MALMVLIGMIAVGCYAAETKENVNDAAVGWAGTWIDTMGTQVLTVDGRNVTGVYTDPPIAVSRTGEGTISEDGKVLSGSWSQFGPFTFTLSDDGTYFNGTYGYGESNAVDEADDTWNGTLTTEVDTEKPWSGSWIEEIGDVTILNQNGTRVSGVYQTSDLSEITVVEGTVSEDGKELTGIWTQSGLSTLTMSDDGMYFNGTFGFGSKDFIEGIDENWNGVRSG